VIDAHGQRGPPRQSACDEAGRHHAHVSQGALTSPISLSISSASFGKAGSELRRRSPSPAPCLDPHAQVFFRDVTRLDRDHHPCFQCHIEAARIVHFKPTWWPSPCT
jgi:hypothetical protein